ncbi:MAG: hypothetical protein M1822_006847 [Bathelium mastoideum]|nr:MAG: hypothetical protein M1822_006847 [Bathelium mastoideum]
MASPDAFLVASDTILTHRPSLFFRLPYELRMRIYEIVLLVPDTIDLDPTNTRRIAPRLNIFLVCKRMHEEALRIFYGSNTFRLYPISPRFFHDKRPLLARLPTRYRAAITKLELRIGPGWTAPPRSWNTSPSLGLADATATRLLKIFVEFDPCSHDVFRGFRVTDEFYTLFCQSLTRGILHQIPSIEAVQFDAWIAVSKHAPLVSVLLTEVRVAKKEIRWGPLRGWNDGAEETIGSVGLEDAMAMISL